MDRDRFRTRARELRAFAERMAPLAKMPDRVTGADLQLAAELANKAAASLDELLEARLPGCICRLIENDNYSYLDYAEACRHHGSLFAQERQLKEGYTKAEKALKNEARMKLVAAALTGAATRHDTSEAPAGWTSVTGPAVETVVERAITIADATIKRIAGDM